MRFTGDPSYCSLASAAERLQSSRLVVRVRLQRGTTVEREGVTHAPTAAACCKYHPAAGMRFEMMRLYDSQAVLIRVQCIGLS